MIGWANVSLQDGRLTPEFGYASGKAPRSAAFRQALDDDLHRMRLFLGCA